MATSQEIIEESELAKSYVTSSDLDESYKKQLIRLINTTTIATNGISQEEKIQKMTEAIHLLAISQITFISKVDDKIRSSIEKANIRQCNSCLAMKHAVEVEEEKKQAEIIEAWKKQNGIKDKPAADTATVATPATPLTLADTVKMILVKPYAWIFGSILVFSPYGAEIVKMFLDFFSK